jgi:hypothetical protein
VGFFYFSSLSWRLFFFSNYNPVLPSFNTYHRVGNKSNTTVLHVEQELLTLPEHLSSPLPGFSWGSWCSIFNFLCNVLSILLRFTASDYTCGFIKLFLHTVCREEGGYWGIMFMTYHRVWLTRRVSLVEQELHTLPEHLNSPPVFSGVRVTWSLVLCVRFVDRCLSFCTFSFGHCVVCFSSIYGFWLPLWYLQTLSTCHVTNNLVCFVFYVTSSQLSHIPK